MRRAAVADPEPTADAMYRALGRGLCEFLWMACRRRFPLDQWVRIDAEVEERLARAAPRGAVIATAHTGNWDLLACAAAARLPLTVVTKRLSIGVLNRFWQKARARRGVHLIGAGGAAREALRALARRELVAMLIDQAPERERATVVTEFLGHPARVDLAPALVALRAGVPLACAFCRRDADGKLLVQLGSVLAPPARPSRRWAEQAMIDVTRELDAFVRRHPEQWLWMHRRWKDAPAVAPEREPPVVVSGTDEPGPRRAA
jgi:KDO2-lipid IV(A) lauroyltransferase